MTALRIIDSISLPGSSDRPNEDAWGANPSCVFVLDGATGLGQSFIEPEASDASWLANMASEILAEQVRPEIHVELVVAEICRRVRTVVDGLSAPDAPPAWALPVASFQLVRLSATGSVETYGLGDCRLIAVSGNTLKADLSPMPQGRSRESESARQAIARAGGLSAMRLFGRDDQTLDELRASRAAYNLEGSAVWTLGAFPEAASHMATATIPANEPTVCLLCSDGFAALADLYQRYTPAELVHAAAGKGLAALGEELRKIERDEDPEGARYPRYKASDDATAVLFEIAP